MPESTEKPPCGWWQYECDAWKKACAKMGGWFGFWDALGSIIAGMTIAMLEFMEGFKPEHEALFAAVNIAGVAVLILLVRLLFHLLRQPSIMAKEQNDIIIQLRDELQKIKSEQVEFVVEAINPTAIDYNNYQYPLRINITHNQPNKTVKNVRVLIAEIHCPEMRDSLLSLPLKKFQLPHYLPEVKTPD